MEAIRQARLFYTILQLLRRLQLCGTMMAHKHGFEKVKTGQNGQKQTEENLRIFFKAVHRTHNNTIFMMIQQEKKLVFWEFISNVYRG